MPFEITSSTHGKGLYLKLINEVSIESFVEIDSQINTHLRQTTEAVVLIVDASSAKVNPYSIERIKPTQTYLQSTKINRIAVISPSKLNRLAMLLLFNLCRPILQFYDSLEHAPALFEIPKSREITE